MAAEADALPPLRQVPTLDTRNQKDVGQGREGLRVGDAEGPINPSTLPGRASDPGLVGVLDGHQGRVDARSGFGAEAEEEDLDEIEL